ncbi:MAG: hypothetical protein ABSG99_05565 [Sedimentisphaerales bacterium]
MNERNEKKLKELFEKFVGGEQAEQAAEDIQKGEQILREHSSPEPDGGLIANIKAEIAAKLLHKKEKSFRWMAYKMAVAAAFILIAVISVKLFETVPERPAGDLTAQKAIWESQSLADETLTAEMEQIESDMLAMESGENSGNGYETVTDLEMKLIETNGDFWKG